MITEDHKIVIPVKNLLYYQSKGEFSTRICMIHSMSPKNGTKFIEIEHDNWVWVRGDNVALDEFDGVSPGSYYPTYQFWEENQKYYISAWESFEYAIQRGKTSMKKADVQAAIDLVEEFYDIIEKTTEEFLIQNPDWDIKK